MDLPSTKHYGDYAVSLGVLYYQAQGHQVLLPYGDRGHYDFAIEQNGAFDRVQSKYCSRLNENGYPQVSLKVIGWKGNNHLYSQSDFDLLWAVTPVGCFSIPSSAIYGNRPQRNDLKLTPRWACYRVEMPIPSPLQDEWPKNNPRLANEEKQRIFELKDSGADTAFIAEQIGITASHVRVVLSRKAPI